MKKDKSRRLLAKMFDAMKAKAIQNLREQDMPIGDWRANVPEIYFEVEDYFENILNTKGVL